MCGGKILSPKRREKMRLFMKRMELKKRDPRNCKRCGNPRDRDGYAQCQRCLDRAAEYRRGQRISQLVVSKDAANLLPLLRRIESLELAVARLQHFEAKINRREYQRAYLRGAKNAKRLLEKPTPETIIPGPFDFEGLNQMSHLFARTG